MVEKPRGIINAAMQGERGPKLRLTLWTNGVELVEVLAELAPHLVESSPKQCVALLAVVTRWGPKAKIGRPRKQERTTSHASRGRPSKAADYEIAAAVYLMATRLYPKRDLKRVLEFIESQVSSGRSLSRKYLRGMVGNARTLATVKHELDVNAAFSQGMERLAHRAMGTKLRK